MSRVYAAARGLLADYDGATLTVAAMTADYISTDTDPDLSSITGEVDVADAPSYTRQSVTATWDTGTETLTISGPVTFDLDGTDVASIVFADNIGDLISEVTLPMPAPGVDGMVFTFDDGIAAIADPGTIRADIASLDARVTALEDAAGGGATWEQRSGGDVATWRLDVLYKLVWDAGAVPVVDSPPGPVLVATVHVEHRPTVPVQGIGFWVDAGTSGTLSVLVDDTTGSVLGTAGGVWLQDATGTLTDTDDVTPKLSTIEWWQA